MEMVFELLVCEGFQNLLVLGASANIPELIPR